MFKPNIRSKSRRGNSVVEVTQSAKKWVLETEFDAFLFAPIGEEKNGMLLSVLSALARLDIDPWREAAELARLPKGVANRRVTSLIKGLEIASPTPLEPETIAARLVALLPSALVSPVSNEALLAGGVDMSARGVVFAVLISLVLMVAMAGGRWAVENHDPQAPLDRSGVSTASDVPQQASSSRGSD